MYSDVFPRQENCGRGGGVVVYGRDGRGVSSFMDYKKVFLIDSLN